MRASLNYTDVKYPSLPFVTVVTVVFNCKNQLERTIESVINQSYPNIEYVIIDGGSDDGTVDIIKKYEDYIDYWVSELDEGIFSAMNKGIDAGSGDYYYFLNAGDELTSRNTITTVFEALLSNNQLPDLISGNVMLTYKEREIGIAYLNPWIPHQGAFVCKSLMKYFRFNEKLKYYGDLDLWIRLKLAGKFHPVQNSEIIAYFPLGGAGNSFKNTFLRLKERYALRHSGAPLSHISFLATLLDYSVRLILGNKFYYIYYSRLKIQCRKQVCAFGKHA